MNDLALRAFEKYWSDKARALDDFNHLDRMDARKVFESAFNLLLPFIEKQNEALKFYGKDAWIELDEHPNHLIEVKANDCNLNDETTRQLIGGKTARSTLSFVDSELKRIGGEHE